MQREEELKKSKDKISSLEADNKTLVDRWMLQKEKEASKMNEANEIVESALAKVSVATKVFNHIASS